MTPTKFATPQKTHVFVLAKDHNPGEATLSVLPDLGYQFPAGGWIRVTAFLDVQDGPAAIFAATGLTSDGLVVSGVVDGYGDVALPAGTSLLVGETPGTFADIQGAINALEVAPSVSDLPGGGKVVSDSVAGGWDRRTIVMLSSDGPSAVASSAGGELCAYCAGTGHYYRDAQKGDLVYRAAKGHRLLLGVSNDDGTSLSSLKVGDSSAAFSVPVAPGSSSDGSAPNNSIYFSTDRKKLVYKDQSGVVNELY